jgi:ubiquitin carboxyl-terminal hydrolase L3
MLFVPLEANPESFNPLASVLGLDTSRYSFVDVLGFDEDLLALIPQPVEAVIMLFPTLERWDDPKRMLVEGETDDTVDKEGLVYFRQRLSNHCGTIVRPEF